MRALQAVDPNLETTWADPDRHFGQTISPPGGAIPNPDSFSRPSPVIQSLLHGGS